jgi:hypothetical protein
VPGKLNRRKWSFPYIVPASQALFLAVGMLVPATDRCRLGGAKELPVMSARREAFVDAVAAHNRSHKRLPNSAVRLLEVMFASADVCQQSIETLEDVAGLSRKTVQVALRALLEAGIIAKEDPGAGRHANRYRLLLAAGSGT